ncbi:hypothetical protein LCL95_04065 [Bacillus timonensis]|nr:hypothetical protein [Bacillus timonensis]
MPYESKIRTFNPDRVTKNTTISTSLLNDIKTLAHAMNMPFNSLIEAGIQHVLVTYKNPKSFTKPPQKPIDRKQMGTTFSDIQYAELKDRAKKLNTNTNTLIEIGMKYILNKYKS